MRVEDTSTTSEAQALGPEISNLSSPRLETRSCPGVEERLRNLETHVGYRPGIDNIIKKITYIDCCRLGLQKLVEKKLISKVAL